MPRKFKREQCDNTKHVLSLYRTWDELSALDILEKSTLNLRHVDVSNSIKSLNEGWYIKRVRRGVYKIIEGA